MAKRLKYILRPDGEPISSTTGNLNEIIAGDFLTLDPKRTSLTLVFQEEKTDIRGHPEIPEDYECILNDDNNIYIRRKRTDGNGLLEDTILKLENDTSTGTGIKITALPNAGSDYANLPWSEDVNPQPPYDANKLLKEHKRETVTFDRGNKGSKYSDNPQLWHKVRMADGKDYQVISMPDSSKDSGDKKGSELYARAYDKNGKLENKVYIYEPEAIDKDKQLKAQPNNQTLISSLPWSSASSYEDEIQRRRDRIYNHEDKERIKKFQSENRALTIEEQQWIESKIRQLNQLQACLEKNESVTRLNYDDKNAIPIVKQNFISQPTKNELEELTGTLSNIIHRNAQHVMVQIIKPDGTFVFETKTMAERNQMDFSGNSVTIVYHPKKEPTSDHSLCSDTAENAYMVVTSKTCEDLTKPENMVGAVVSMLSNADLNKPIYLRTNAGSEVLKEWMKMIIVTADGMGMMNTVLKKLEPQDIAQKVYNEFHERSSIWTVKELEDFQALAKNALSARDQSLVKTPQTPLPSPPTSPTISKLKIQQSSSPADPSGKDEEFNDEEKSSLGDYELQPLLSKKKALPSATAISKARRYGVHM